MISEKNEAVTIRQFDSHKICDFDLTRDMTLDPDLMDEDDLRSPRDQVPVFYRFFCKISSGIS